MVFLGLIIYTHAMGVINSFEIKGILLDNPGADPLGFEELLILEEYNRVINGLLACYGRLIYNDMFHGSLALTTVGDTGYWRYRRTILIFIKNISRQSGLTAIRDITLRYRSELTDLLDYEDSFKL